MSNKQLKRRANILYRLRKKNVVCDRKRRTVFLPVGTDPDSYIQLIRLRKKYGFHVQFRLQ